MSQTFLKTDLPLNPLNTFTFIIKIALKTNQKTLNQRLIIKSKDYNYSNNLLMNNFFMESILAMMSLKN